MNFTRSSSSAAGRRTCDQEVAISILGNDSGQVVHSYAPQRRQYSLVYGVVKPDRPTFTSTWRYTLSLMLVSEYSQP